MKSLRYEPRTRYDASCEILDLGVPSVRYAHSIRCLAGLACLGSVVSSLFLYGPAYLANLMQCERHGCPGLQAVDAFILSHAHVNSMLSAFSTPFLGSIAQVSNFIGFVSAFPFVEQLHFIIDKIKTLTFVT